MLGDFVLPSLEIAGPGMHWVEVSRAVAAESAKLSDDTKAMAEAYDEYYEAAKTAMRAGASCHDVHMAVSKGFTRPRLPPRTRHRPLDRDDDDRVPEGGGGRRHRATGEHGALDAPPCDRRRTARTASTCRTPGSSRRRAACRSPGSRWRSWCDEPGGRPRPQRGRHRAVLVGRRRPPRVPRLPRRRVGAAR